MAFSLMGRRYGINETIIFTICKSRKYYGHFKGGNIGPFNSNNRMEIKDKYVFTRGISYFSSLNVGS
ncbi:hypothetical protein ABDX87_03755 [Pseudomonas abietaniphila]|uniref:hypothetical protein n=1 Tax=Pseudomonas abietaniphila TaxID=89065 RepID=UPI0032169E11